MTACVCWENWPVQAVLHGIHGVGAWHSTAFLPAGGYGCAVSQKKAALESFIWQEMPVGVSWSFPEAWPMALPL